MSILQDYRYIYFDSSKYCEMIINSYTHQGLQADNMF